MSALSKVYDPSGGDHIDYHRFVDDLHCGQTERRQALVDKAFDKLVHSSPQETASASEPTATIEEFQSVFDAWAAPDVKAGRLDPSILTQHFASQFSGNCSRSDWAAIFEDFGAAIPSDEYFVTFVENCFGVRETEADEYL